MLFMLASLILLFLAACIIGVVASLLILHKRYDHLPGPPRSGFFLGNGSYLKEAKDKEHGIAKLLHRWMEEYGPCYKIFVFHICIIVVTGPTFVKEFLIKSQYPKSKQIYAATRYVFGQRCLGDGLFSETDHTRWQQRRSIVGPAFSKKSLRLFMEQFNEIGDRWINGLAEIADGKTFIKLYDDFCLLTLDAISEIGFNDQLNGMDMVRGGNGNEFSLAARRLLEGIMSVSEDVFIRFRPDKVVFRRSVREAIKFLRCHGQRLINERRSYVASGAEPPSDMLNSILKYKELYGASDDDLVDDFLTLFLAGQDTTATALSWLFMDLGRHTDVWDKVCKEVENVLGDRREVKFEDLARLDYMNQVIKESLRMHPPAPNTVREVQEEVMVDGYKIPPGSNILFPIFAIHNSSKHYTNPFEFQPERFTKLDQKELYTYLPFSVGARSCIGKQFAVMEIKVLLCKFVQRFNFQLDPNQSFDMIDDSSIRPVSGTVACITHRVN